MPPLPKKDDIAHLSMHASISIRRRKTHPHPLLTATEKRELPHTWRGKVSDARTASSPACPVRRNIFIAAFLFYTLNRYSRVRVFVGGNSVSIDKIAIDIIGPKTIAGGDIVPLSLPSRIEIQSQLKMQLLR